MDGWNVWLSNWKRDVITTTTLHHHIFFYDITGQVKGGGGKKIQLMHSMLTEMTLVTLILWFRYSCKIYRGSLRELKQLAIFSESHLELWLLHKHILSFSSLPIKRVNKVSQSIVFVPLVQTFPSCSVNVIESQRFALHRNRRGSYPCGQPHFAPCFDLKMQWKYLAFRWHAGERCDGSTALQRPEFRHPALRAGLTDGRTEWQITGREAGVGCGIPSPHKRLKQNAWHNQEESSGMPMRLSQRLPRLCSSDWLKHIISFVIMISWVIISTKVAHSPILRRQGSCLVATVKGKEKCQRLSRCGRCTSP